MKDAIRTDPAAPIDPAGPADAGPGGAAAPRGAGRVRPAAARAFSLRRRFGGFGGWRPARMRSERPAGCTEMPAERMTPPHGFAMLPWLLMEVGPVSDLVAGNTPAPWLGWPGIIAFDVLYVIIVFRAFDKQRRRKRSSRGILAAMSAVAFALAIGYGGTWQLLFPLLALAIGSVLRGPRLALLMIVLAGAAAAVSGIESGWGSAGIGYGTFISGMVTAALLALRETITELRETREELARAAVESERLRFSRDLHDLLGHTLSVIVVKSEAARRIAHRDLGAALVQVTDIESVGRQALTEIREAVTGYREGSLATELDRARSALTAAGIEPTVRQSGPPLPAPTEALLGWVLREAVTNAIRHSAASRCEITVEGSGERVLLKVADNGRGAVHGQDPEARPLIGGTGLKGLSERLSAAGGSLLARPRSWGGFQVLAELPVEGSQESGHLVVREARGV